MGTGTRITSTHVLLCRTPAIRRCLIAVTRMATVSTRPATQTTTLYLVARPRIEDGDGFLNRQDNCPLIANGSPLFQSGVVSGADTMRPFNSLDNQMDQDFDDIGDTCDPDPASRRTVRRSWSASYWRSRSRRCLGFRRSAELSRLSALLSARMPVQLMLRLRMRERQASLRSRSGSLRLALGLVRCVLGSGAVYLLRRRRGLDSRLRRALRNVFADVAEEVLDGDDKGFVVAGDEGDVAEAADRHLVEGDGDGVLRRGA